MIYGPPSKFIRITCGRCGKKVEVCHLSTHPPPTVCRKCEKEQAEEDRAIFLAELGRKSVKERLARIEAAIYDLEGRR